MLRALYERTPTPFDHFVVDNGSVDGTREFLREEWGRCVRIIANPDNRGISVASNQVLEAIGEGYDYIVKVDNDCEIVTHDWLGRILGVMRAFGDRAMLSPFVDGLRNHKGGASRRGHQRVGGLTVGLVENLGGICLVAPAAAYADYRFDESLPLRGNQDFAFSRHAIGAGYQLGYVEEIVVRHMDTTEGQHQAYPEYFDLVSKEEWTVYGKSHAISKPVLKVRHKLTQLGLLRGPS